jgi:uncharacterized protein
MRRRGANGPESGNILAVPRAGRDVPSGLRQDIEIVSAGARIPAVLLLPGADGPHPAALLLHGLGSRKERMADSVGDGLMKRGVAALAVDLPLHGARADAGDDPRTMSPMDLVGSWSEAVAEAHASLAFLASHPGIDAHRLGVVGYSLGSFLANLVASTQPDVRAIVLAASGDLPEGLPFASLIRSVIDPLRAVRSLAGRPLLMVNGRLDRTVTPRQGELLFAAAGEPKAIRWYNGGHWPPPSEIAFACDWLATRLGAGDARRPRTRASSAS